MEREGRQRPGTACGVERDLAGIPGPGFVDLPVARQLGIQGKALVPSGPQFPRLYNQVAAIREL